MIVAPLHPRVQSDTCELLFELGGGQGNVTLEKDGEELILTVQEKGIIASVVLDLEAAIHLRTAVRNYFTARRDADVMESRGGY